MTTQPNAATYTFYTIDYVRKYFHVWCDSHGLDSYHLDIFSLIITGL